MFATPRPVAAEAAVGVADADGYAPVAGRHLERIHIETLKRFAGQKAGIAAERETLNAYHYEVKRLVMEKERVVDASFTLDEEKSTAMPKPALKKGAIKRLRATVSSKKADAIHQVERRLKVAQAALAKQEAFVIDIESGKAEMDYMMKSTEIVNNYYVRRAQFMREQRQLRDHPQELEVARAEFDRVSKNLFVAYIDKCHPNMRSEADSREWRRTADACKLCGGEVETIGETMRCRECSHCMRDPNGGLPGEVFISYSDRENSTTVRIYRYQRLNHFREILRLVQGVTRTGITEDVADKFRAALRTYKVDPLKLTPEYVRVLLKRIDEARCYKFIHCICADFNPNYKPIVIEPEHFERLVRQFVSSEGPYEATKKSVNPKRKNFLNYPYVAIALCRMNGYTKYIRAFKPLKSMELRIQQDKLWRKVCRENQWPYVNIEGAESISSDFSRQGMKRACDEPAQHDAVAPGPVAKKARRGAPVSFS